MLSSGVWDTGKISRYGRAQIVALQAGYGRANVDFFVAELKTGYGADFDFFVARRRSDNQLEGRFPATRASGNFTLSPGFWGLMARLNFASIVRGYAKQRRPSLVVSQHVNLGPLARTIARRHGVPYIQTIYGREVWSKLSMRRRSALVRSTAVIANCNHTADYVLNAGLATTRPTVVWDCVDLTRYKPQTDTDSAYARYGAVSRGRFRLLFLAELYEDPSYKVSVRALRLLARLPRTFELVIAGHGSDVLHMKALAASLNLGDRVYFTGSVREQDMPAIYAGADAFYVGEVGSNRGEGLPLSAIQALACGTPVIVGDQDGGREVLTDDSAGRCLGLDEDDTALAYLRSLAANGSARLDASRAARARAQQGFGTLGFQERTLATVASVLRRVR